MVEYKPESERKTKTVSVRMTSDDYDAIKAAADAEGMTVSRFLTQAAQSRIEHSVVSLSPDETK